MVINMHIQLANSIEALSKITKNNSLKILLRKEDRFLLSDIFEHLNSKDGLQYLSSWLRFQDRHLPLELLWRLHKDNILQFTTYIYYNTQYVEAINSDFKLALWPENCEDADICCEMVCDLFSVLINIGAHSQRDIAKPCQELLHLVIVQFINDLLATEETKIQPCQYTENLYKVPTIAASKLKAFYLWNLQLIIQNQPDSVDFLYAVKNQNTEYTCDKFPPVVVHFLKQIFVVLNAGDTVQEICSIIISKKYNWKWLLLAMTLFAMNNSESSQALKDAIDSWIMKACKTQDKELLAVALLSARQCGIASTTFGSYAAWFGALQIKSAQGFSFFIQFLSQIVPSEPALYLKIHVNKVPTAPSSCHGLLADYVCLAKTRLNDLNETTDYVGLFNDFHINEQEGRQSDISRVLAHFSETGEIIKTVLEASVFRRQYYEKIFLPELLKVSENKDANRECLVKKLHSMGKIPKAMFRKWSKSTL